MWVPGVYQSLLFLNKQDIAALLWFRSENYVNYVRNKEDVQVRNEIFRYVMGKKMAVFILFILHPKEPNAECVIIPYIFESNVDP